MQAPQFERVCVRAPDFNNTNKQQKQIDANRLLSDFSTLPPLSYFGTVGAVDPKRAA